MARMPDKQWVTFTVTTTGTEFFEQMTALTGSDPGSGGLVTLKDSSWLVTLSIFHQPEVIPQPPGARLWWGFLLYPRRTGDFVKKPGVACTGAEILEEVLRQLRFERQLDAIMASSVCIPCDLPYVNSVWMPRRRSDRPRVVPEGATNLGFLGQFAEVPQEVAFTIEYLRPHGAGSDPPPATARSCATARLSGPVRSSGAVRRAEDTRLTAAPRVLDGYERPVGAAWRARLP